MQILFQGKMLRNTSICNFLKDIKYDFRAALLCRLFTFQSVKDIRIQHFIKVYTFAHMIGELEGMSNEALQILDISSILHDIGIHPAEKKYGNCMGKYQEELGPDVARKLLVPFNLDDKIVDRVCFLIGHHHTYDQVDGLDHKILLEADLLVNSFEDNLEKKRLLRLEIRSLRHKQV